MGNIWGELLVDSLLRPRVAARRLLDLRLPFGILVEAALATTSLGMVLVYIARQFDPATLDELSLFVLDNPLAGVVFQLAALVVVVICILRIGRFFGGKGRIEGALAVVVWLDAVMLVAQALQIVALVLFPPLATLLAFAAILWAIWALACFVSELHDFDNTVVVLGGVIVSMTVVFFGMALLLALLGAPSQGMK